VHHLTRAGIPCGEIKTVGEACSAAQLVERGMVREMRHPTAGDVRYIAGTIRFEDRPPEDAVRPPLLGEHTAQVLATGSAWMQRRPQPMPPPAPSVRGRRTWTNAMREASSIETWTNSQPMPW
jgi:crotonobetainyl-CoA:carnitine CoA-transferase CaiB-like acyl-CoA transferase